MATKITSISNGYDYDLNGIFSASDIAQLMECGREIRQVEAVDALDLNSLFSRVQTPKPGITLKDHLIMVSKMFPVTKCPDVWRDIIMGPTQEENLEETLGREEPYLVTDLQKEPLEEEVGIEKSYIAKGLALLKNTVNAFGILGKHLTSLQSLLFLLWVVAPSWIRCIVGLMLLNQLSMNNKDEPRAP